ncbi:hypothetical protein OBV_25240 [Oscillibacter valericigenes Sjm18-20]|nr:hypothetical protein OBV_25240 [Oscillibacter valericigenes Sjm18-20]
MKDGYWALRKYTAGPVGESIKYWIPGEKPSRSERRIKSDIRKQKANEANCERTFARLTHENFRNGIDQLVGLDYSQEGYEKMLASRVKNLDGLSEIDRIMALAQHQAELFLRRVGRECKKRGIPFRYLMVTSDMDGKTGEAVRVHHHMIVNAEALDICKEKWTMGGVDYEALWKRDDQTDLAEYLMKQVRRLPDAKKYTPSRNLIRPRPKDRIAINGSELRLPKGAALLYRSPYKPGMAQYIRYVLPGVKLGGRENE